MTHVCYICIFHFADHLYKKQTVGKVHLGKLDHIYTHDNKFKVKAMDTFGTHLPSRAKVHQHIQFKCDPAGLLDINM